LADLKRLFELQIDGLRSSPAQSTNLARRARSAANPR
jgi:hypothetical protein